MSKVLGLFSQARGFHGKKGNTNLISMWPPSSDLRGVLVTSVGSIASSLQRRERKGRKEKLPFRFRSIKVMKLSQQSYLSSPKATAFTLDFNFSQLKNDFKISFVYCYLNFSLFHEFSKNFLTWNFTAFKTSYNNEVKHFKTSIWTRNIL